MLFLMKDVRKEMSSFLREIFPRNQPSERLWLCQLSMFVPDGCIIDGVVVWCSLTEPQPERAQQFASHLRQHLNKDECHFFSPPSLLKMGC